MRKIYVYIIMLLIIVIAALFTVVHTTPSAEDSLLKENVAALAYNCPVCGLFPCECEGEGGEEEEEFDVDGGEFDDSKGKIICNTRKTETCMKQCKECSQDIFARKDGQYVQGRGVRFYGKCPHCGHQN